MPHHDHGLAHDLDTLMRRSAQRRRALRWLGLAGAAPLALLGCGGGGDAGATSTSSSDSDSGSATGGGTSTSCSVIPSETAGPYPGDGTNGNGSGTINALTLAGIVRSDIRTSVGSASGTAAGVPLTVTLKLVNTASSCAGLQGYAIYLWHCTRDGGYSLYSAGVADENFLRGVQVTDANGEVSFTTIFPGCYSGRWPHMHFEIYPSLASATSGSNDVKTSQLAMPATACNQVYGTATGYDSSASNFASISLATDNVFSDDQAATQIASVTGSVTAGFAATLTVGIAA
ncbi:dioxygenase family protein [Piscinibacter defluvii]|uniref:dioxygenase family protein n=1 Tax=Piscinibacter defluvii TaxID=1796922 RepID=UPI000FDE45BB|nr:intradiol ring-cleavage dioxygenase [Piscinibacter defluvii]